MILIFRSISSRGFQLLGQAAFGVALATRKSKTRRSKGSIAGRWAAWIWVMKHRRSIPCRCLIAVVFALLNLLEEVHLSRKRERCPLKSMLLKANCLHSVLGVARMNIWNIVEGFVLGVFYTKF